MSKLPYITWFIGDWRKDPGVQALTFHDRGVWFEILGLMYESEDRGKLLLNGQAMPDDALARLLGLDKQVLKVTLDKIMAYGVASKCDVTGAIINRRMVRDEELRKTRQECGRMGGNPALLKQKVNQIPNQNTVDDNDSSSSKGSLRGFDEFWKAYPKKKEIGNAEKAWAKIREPVTTLPAILVAIEKQKRGPEWKKDSGQFIPYPASWLNAKGWLDEPTSVSGQSGATATHPVPEWNQRCEDVRLMLDRNPSFSPHEEAIARGFTAKLTEKDICLLSAEEQERIKELRS